ncbi:MAG: tRNA lysidine(34) synthetase TilS [Verrucomicrobiota bacterium]|jgi:tRNA(Ile)-lysidine synthase|nr:tRNA lysidine(34) synthetase TilS [Verrucomicrobiota bacterium]
MDLSATVRQTVKKHFPALAGKRVLAAVSGGADSMALAWVLKELGVNLSIAHIHHGIRGRRADADARFVRALAAKWEVPFYSARFDVPSEAAAAGESLEMAGRRLRHGFLLETARAKEIPYLATGHTADDQAETVLLRVVRGTSITGLAGIAYQREQQAVTWIRPLRDVRRTQVEAYLKAKKQKWREDETNAEDFALRNRVRNEILPLLEKRLNPAVCRALLRLADIAAAEDAVMAELTKKTKITEKSPIALRRRKAVADLRSEGKEEAFQRVENKIPRHKRIRGAYVGKDHSEAWERTFNPTALRRAGIHRIDVPEAGGQIVLRRSRGFLRKARAVYLSQKAIAGHDLVFRSWRNGDRMKPLGMEGHKKLSDIFTDLKVPSEQRNSWVVVQCGTQIAALVGWRVSRDFAVPDQSTPSVRIMMI